MGGLGLNFGDLLDILPLFPEEDEATIYARWSAWANEGITPAQINEWIDTREGGHFFTWSRPGVREVAKAYDLMGSEFVAAVIPVWSWGIYLDAIAAGFEVERLEAIHADGEVTFFAPAEHEILSGVHVGAEVATPDQQVKEYEVTEGGTVGAPIGPPAGLAAETESTGGGLADGDHFYVVTALNGEGESTPTAALKVNLEVGGDGIVKLSWEALGGATGYRVYHGNVEEGPFFFLAEVTEPAYEDDGTPAPDETTAPPETDWTGNRITLPVEAVEAGVDFNAVVGEVTVQLSEIGADLIVNEAPISGGTDPETDEALLSRLLARFEGIGPGNVRAYEIHVGEFPGVGRVSVFPHWNGDNTVLVVILTAEGNPVSTAVVEAVQADLDPTPGQAEGWAPPGHEVTVVTAETLAVPWSAKIEFEPGFSLDGAAGTVAMRELIEAAVNDYMQSAEPSSEVVRQKVGAQIAAFAGVRDYASLKLDGEEKNVALGSEPPQVAEAGEATLEEGAV